MRPFLAVVLCVAVSLTGCAARVKNVTNLPPGVTLTEAQDWDSAVANLQRINAVVTDARTEVIALHTSGVFPDSPAYVATLTSLGKIDQIQISAANVLKQAPGNFTDSTRGQIKDYMSQISAEVLNLNTAGVTGIKNPTNLQNVSKVIGEISTVVSLILSL